MEEPKKASCMRFHLPQVLKKEERLHIETRETRTW